MAHSDWCGKVCCDCTECFYVIDLEMPCSPDCEVINPVTNLHDIDKCINCGAYIQEVPQEEANEIIETKIAIENFYLIENGLYIGIDNETNEAWTEQYIELTSMDLL